jgi:hypothetical protein
MWAGANCGNLCPRDLMSLDHFSPFTSAIRRTIHSTRRILYARRESPQILTTSQPVDDQDSPEVNFRSKWTHAPWDLPGNAWYTLWPGPGALTPE